MRWNWDPVEWVGGDGGNACDGAPDGQCPPVRPSGDLSAGWLAPMELVDLADGAGVFLARGYRACGCSV